VDDFFTGFIYDWFFFILFLEFKIFILTKRKILSKKMQMEEEVKLTTNSIEFSQPNQETKNLQKHEMISMKHF
jgi:hypothetical protein